MDVESTIDYTKLKLPSRELVQIELDRRECKSFATFVKRAWPVLEPATALKWGWVMDGMTEHLQAVTTGDIQNLLMNVPPGTSKSTVAGILFPAFEWGPAALPHHRYLGTAHRLNLAVRDNLKCRRLIQSPWFQKRWPIKLTSDVNAKEKFENSDTGFREAMPFTSMTGSRGSRVLLDDPLSVDDANSDPRMLEAELAFTETLPTRVNDDKSAIIVIMQRLNEKDTSGIILDRGLDYTHFMVPMEFEMERRCSTKIGWRDPRTYEGELMFPERFPRKQVENLKKTMGEYACTPGESPILMSDLTSKPINEVKIGDYVMGFKAPTVGKGKRHSLQKLCPSKVINVFKYSSKPISKLTFDDGTTARCTPDHKWYKRQRSDRDYAIGAYGVANVGSPLVRVCDAELPALSPEEERKAGWIAGFFDGDGSCTWSERDENASPASTICFYQGAGRNRHICDKLERYLTDLGFEYSYTTDDRKDPTVGVNFEYRVYRLLGKNLPVSQRFLHMVQPTKWRERLVKRTYAANFCYKKSRVTSIEPDGLEDVYALETETGNYVVWGIASSNSAGQFQQAPVPRGGGLFKLEWFQKISAIPVDCIFARGWDLASTVSRTAAYTASVKIGKTPDGKIVIADVTRDKMSSSGVRNKILVTTQQDGILTRQSIPQDPGQAGKAQVNQFAIDLAGYDVRFSTESGDKVTRALPLSAQAEAGNVYYVEAEWNKPFLDELSMFPNGKFKDQSDAASRAYAELLKLTKTRGQPLGRGPVDASKYLDL